MNKNNTTATSTKVLLSSTTTICTFMKNVPTISSFSVAKNWSTDKTEALSDAVQKVVEANPILSAHLDARKGYIGGDEIIAVSGHTLFTSKDIFKIVQTPNKDLSPSIFQSDANPTDLLQQLEDHVIPHFPDRVKGLARLGKDEIREKSPLFEVYLMALPNNHACYAVAMSHSVGDGAIYYQVLEQLNAAMTKGTIGTEINWDGYDKIPEIASDLLGHPVPLIGMALGNVMFNTFGPSKAALEPKVVLLSKEKINHMKTKLKGENTKFLSSNDVIMSALCGAMLDKADVQTQYVNARGKYPGVEANDAGNFLETQFMSSRACLDPNVVRNLASTGKHYRSPWSPLMPLLRARFVQNTNWAGQKKVLDDTIAHVPAKSFLRARDTSMLASYFTIIFEYDKDTLGVVSNCPITKDGLMQAIMA